VIVFQVVFWGVFAALLWGWWKAYAGVPPQVEPKDDERIT
jgi:hypothetical protein